MAKIETPIAATPATETPIAATPATETPIAATPATDDESELKAKLAAMQKVKDEQAKEIAELQSDIVHAESEVKKYASIMTGTSDMDVMIQELVNKQIGKLESINSAPDMARKALADYKLSILSPAEKAARENWNSAEIAVKDASDKLTSLRAEIIAKYPDFFGVQKAHKANAPKGDGSPKSTTLTPFAGVLNSKEVDEVAIKAIFTEAIAKGTPTNESVILKTLYPGDYTLSNSPVKLSRHTMYVKYAKEFGVWTGA